MAVLFKFWNFFLKIRWKDKIVETLKNLKRNGQAIKIQKVYSIFTTLLIKSKAPQAKLCTSSLVSSVGFWKKFLIGLT